MKDTLISPLLPLLTMAFVMHAAFAQESTAASVEVHPLREAYFGDLHLHTSYSLDAYLVGSTKVDPDEAYRFAKGEVVNYLGEAVRRREPLDFMAVTDHSELMGVADTLADPNSEFSRSQVGRDLENGRRMPGRSPGSIPGRSRNRRGSGK